MVREGLVGALALQTGPCDMIGIDYDRMINVWSLLLGGPYKLST